MTGEEKVVLGSGKLYVAVFDEKTGIPEDAVLETETNRLGDIQGGATLSYTPEFYTLEDDLGLVKKVFLTKETATLKTGILTWNGNTLAKLLSTAEITEDTSKKKRIVKIGGLGRFNETDYVIRFVHATNGNRVTIVGKNSGGLEFAYQPSQETVINAEFSAVPQDSDGTLITFEEDME